ncbi:MAG: fibronectin type III domain-containing protein [Lachnospiraceae bacterium]|nr:fibronectin type III domain-containing protein [Lachnospiraceae bacterium]
MRKSKLIGTILVACGMLLAGTMGKPVVSCAAGTDNVVESDVQQRGTAVDLTISSARELNEFAQKVNNGNDYEGMTIKLTNDIVYDGVTVNNYTPIGINNHCFRGTFDGDGHTISGIIVSSQSYVGLFGLLEGNVQNVTVKNCSFEGYSGGGIACSLSSKNSETKISNCQVVDCIIKTEDESGGIVAEVNSNSLVVNCFAKSKVSGNGYERWATGGIAGYSRGKIYNCSYMGSVTNDKGYAGGICGYLEYNAAEIQNCFNAGVVSGKEGRVGGIVGYGGAATIVANCYTAEAACTTNFGAMNGTERGCKAYSDAYMRGGEFLNLMNANRGANGAWTAWEKRAESPYPVPAKAVSIANYSVSLASGDIVYTGEEQKPAVVVANGGTTLVQDVDYTVTYENNVNAGQAAVIVRGCGRYMGDVTLPFTIQKADTVIKFKAPGTKVYNTYGYTTSLGAKIEKGNEKGKLSYQSSDQSVATVSDAGTIHDEGVGATTITITCPESDNYKAVTVSTVYTIKPGKQTAFVKRSGKKMRVSWYKVSSASGYQLQYAAKKSFKKCKTITIRKKSKTKYTIKKLKRGKTYYVRVRTYKNANVNGQQTVVTGAWSKARKVR